MNKVIWKRKATKQLRSIARDKRVKIIEAVGDLVDFSKNKNVKKLKNLDSQYRLRVGNYRVFFNHWKEVQIVSVEEVRKRDERTY